MPTLCLKCGHENPSGVAICANCAAPLVNLCPNCGFENPPGFKYCGNCGTNLITASLARLSNTDQLRRLSGYIPGNLADKILHASRQIEGERRTVTVLFSDVVGFTTISERLDPETVYNIIDASVTAFRDEIYAHEGTLDKFMGDGVMALFGAPVAHEDDPARAMRCALGMQAALETINRDLVARHGITLQMRIGLNLGTVVVADIGADLRMNYTALGDTVNVAARLQSAAEPGTILASRAVYEQTQALFEFAELGFIRVKGRSEPVEIFQVIQAKREPGRVRGIPGLAAPMVGRADELLECQRVVDQLERARRGGVVLVTGEAGIGKSRLTTEFAQWIARESAPSRVRVLQGDCAAYGQSAYDVFVKLLNGLFDIQPDDSNDARRTKIRAVVREMMPKPRVEIETLPFIESFMGLPPGENDARARIRHLEPAQLRQQTFLAVRDLLVHAARVIPLVLILEDLHWVDKTSLDLLLFLVSATEEEPIVLFCVTRPNEGQAAGQIQRVAAATLGGQFTHITLNPLSFQDSTALVESLLSIRDLPATLRQLIPQRAEGNPFYVEEILRTLIDQGIIQRRGNRWEVQPGADMQAFQIPRTLEGLIMARVDHLDESARFTAQCAAVIGRDFPSTILQKISDGNAPHVETDLQELLDKELIHQTARAPERQYVFHHVLTQQTIYNSVLLRRREQLHHKIAAAIEELYPDRLDEQSERLAFHYGESKDAARALPHVVRTAERAAARYANEEALSAYRTALEMAGRAGASNDLRIRILVGLGDSQTHIGDFENAAANLNAAWQLASAQTEGAKGVRQAAEIARRLGRVYERRGKYDEAMQWLESALQEINRDPTSTRAVERVRIYLDIGWVHYRRGGLDQAEHWRVRALEISEGLDYYAEIASAYNGLAAVANLRGDWNHAIEYARRGLAVRETIGDLEGMSRSNTNLGGILFNIGRWDQALPHLEHSLELKQRIGDAKFLAGAYSNLGYYRLHTGDLAGARELFERARRHAEKIRDTNADCLALNALGLTEILQEQYEAAMLYLTTSYARAQDAGARESLIEAQWIRAEAELGKGALTQARRDAEQALDQAQQYGMKQGEASALRTLGRIERAAHNYTTAESHLYRSLVLFNELQIPFEAASSELELGILAADKHKWQTARTHLEHCRDTLARLGEANQLRRARAALEALDAATS